MDESVRVTISARRGSAEFFNHSYSLGPGEGDDSKSFVGTPTEVRVAIPNSRTVSRDYSVPTSCKSQELNVPIEPNKIFATNGCSNS